ncbi:MAG: cysteine desulfurase family protein [Candidatus Marinimicrobia bacterium]|jgi:cysteine desulfurase|nr:cysteine desulfurase family protein [Candidatus Neomarinimicrobiota bacterium]|tara:strand:+ start:956 stop:2083 length:1128 start_codon:yes stop_codon:yes gene_type:complete
MYYFDHCATTPLHEKVMEVMQKTESEHFGNPSSTHSWGQKSRSIIENARNQMADSIGCSPYEIIFTGGGTESNNLVLYNSIHRSKKHVITSAIEHPAILKVLNRLKQFGIETTILNVDKTGMINPTHLKDAIRKNTGLISIMYANNETGVIQPLSELAKIAKDNGIPFHSDGVQALGKIPVNVYETGVTMMSFSAHKFYGPKGVGALFIKENTPLRSFIIGGGQERNLRAGTENVPGIAGMGMAAKLAKSELSGTETHLKKLAVLFKSSLKNHIKNINFNSAPEQLPGIVSVTFPSTDSGKLIIGLSRRGMAVSSGSACSSGTVKPSHVLNAIGLSNEMNLKTLRISFGKGNSEDEAIELAEAISQIVTGKPVHA